MSEANDTFSFPLNPNQLFARLQVPYIKQRFQFGEIAPGALLIQPMPITGDGGPDRLEPAYIWIAVDTWENNLIVGKIAEAPSKPGLQLGRTMMVDDKHILDWKIIGSSEGEGLAPISSADHTNIPLPDFVDRRSLPGYVADATRWSRDIFAQQIASQVGAVKALQTRLMATIACAIAGVIAYQWIGRWSLVILAVAVGIGVRQAKVLDRMKRIAGDTRSLAERGQLVTACMLLGDPALLDPGVNNEVCRVVFLHDETEGDFRYLDRLCTMLSDVRDNPGAPNHRFVTDFINQPGDILSPPRKLPAELTEGRTVYMADVMMYRNRMKHGCAESPLFPCFAVPGEPVCVRLLHWSTLEDTPEARAMREPSPT